jgi:hypothetical protein
VQTSPASAGVPTRQQEDASGSAYIAQALSKIRVTMSETTMEPTTPSPFEKKRNIPATSFATTKEAAARSDQSGTRSWA